MPNLSGAKDRDKCKLVAKRVVLSPAEPVASAAIEIGGWPHAAVRASNSELLCFQRVFIVDVLTKTFFRVFSREI